MELESLFLLCREAMQLSVLVSLPVLGTVALVGFCVSLLQAAMQLQEQSLGQVARLLTTLGALLLAGSWMGTQVLQFAIKAFGGS